LLSYLPAPITYFRMLAVGGYRAKSQNGKPWSVLISWLQKAARRSHAESIPSLSYEIYTVLQCGVKSNTTNFMNRVFVILAEDIALDIGLLDNIISLYNRFVKGEDDLWSTVHNICRLMCNTKAQSRSPSVVRNLMLSYTKDVDIPEFKAERKDISRQHFKSHMKEKHWYAFLDIADTCLGAKTARKNGLLSARGKADMLYLWKDLKDLCVDTNQRKIIGQWMSIWDLRWQHREQYLWVIKAVLCVFTAFKDYPKHEQILEQTEVVALSACDPPDWAFDMHCGRFSKNSITGVQNFLSVGLQMSSESRDLPDWIYDYYVQMKLQRVEMKSTERKVTIPKPYPNEIRLNKKILTKIDGQQIEWVGRRQLPCGNGKPGTFSVVANGNTFFVKEVKDPDTVRFQLFIETIKPKFGLIPLGLKYEKDGYMWCTDLGRGGPYNLVPHPKRSDVQIISQDINNAMQASSMDATLFTFEMWIELFRILAFRSIFVVSDTHLRNIIVTPNYKLVSCDEMTFRKELLDTEHTDLWDMLFVRTPTTSFLKLFKESIIERKHVIFQMLTQWGPVFDLIVSVNTMIPYRQSLLKRLEDIRAYVVMLQ
jgi:hypothetical protein